MPLMFLSLFAIITSVLLPGNTFPKIQLGVDNYLPIPYDLIISFFLEIKNSTPFFNRS